MKLNVNTVIKISGWVLTVAGGILSAVGTANENSPGLLEAIKEFANSKK